MAEESDYQRRPAGLRKVRMWQTRNGQSYPKPCEMLGWTHEPALAPLQLSVQQAPSRSRYRHRFGQCCPNDRRSPRHGRRHTPIDLGSHRTDNAFVASQPSMSFSIVGDAYGSQLVCILLTLLADDWLENGSFALRGSVLLMEQSRCGIVMLA